MWQHFQNINAMGSLAQIVFVLCHRAIGNMADIDIDSLLDDDDAGGVVAVPADVNDTGCANTIDSPMRRSC